MSPIRLDRSERASLHKLVRRDGFCKHKEISESHAERFLRDGLVSRSPVYYHLTMKGQVEFLRQRYRRLRSAKRSVMLDERNTLLDKRAFG